MNIAIIDSRATDAYERALRLQGFDILRLPRCSSLGEAVSSHPDTLLFRCGDDIVTSADYCDEAAYIFSDIRERVPRVRIHFTPDSLGKTYPEDCKFNGLVMGGALFCRTESISESILRIARDTGLDIVSVKQGYPACATLALGDRAAITSDPGMARALDERGIRVYTIEPGYIDLPPHEYGFIGGACGVYQDKIYFFGNYKLHPSSDIIESGARENGYTPVSLGTGRLVDLGGIVFLKEKP